MRRTSAAETILLGGLVTTATLRRSRCVTPKSRLSCKILNGNRTTSPIGTNVKDRKRRMLRVLALAAVVSLVYVGIAGDEPKTARYYRQQAIAAYKAKDYALAAENFNKALALIPDHPTLLYNLG